MKTFILTYFTFFILISLAFSQEKCDKQLFTLRGKIIGQNSGEIILKYVVSHKSKIDTALLNNGEFVLQGNISEPKAADLIMGNNLNTTQIYIEPGEMKITLTKDKFNEFKMTGSKTQGEANKLNSLLAPVLKQKEIVWKKYAALRDSLSKITSEGLLFEKLEKTKEYNLNSQLQDQLNSIKLQFIQSNPRSYLSADMLNFFNKNTVISLDSLKSLYNNFELIIQNSSSGKEIKKDIAKKQNNRIGAAAPDFRATDINNQLVTLSQFKGKNIVLMDFWASWCIPCRESFSHLKEVYKKYHSKGIEIIGVSIDFNRSAWISSIHSDSTNSWHHVPVAEKYAEGPTKLTKDDIYENYFVIAIPRLIMIDKNGKITGNWEGYSEQNHQELDQLLSKAFSEKLK